jgi:hypothetical protein
MTAGTPSTGISPVFSTKTSVQPTPDTSDIDEDINIPKTVGRPKRITRASFNLAKKRPAEINGDPDNDAEEMTSSLPRKRRVVTRTAYVEISVKNVCRSHAKVMILFPFNDRKQTN